MIYSAKNMRPLNEASLIRSKEPRSFFETVANFVRYVNESDFEDYEIKVVDSYDRMHIDNDISVKDTEDIIKDMRNSRNDSSYFPVLSVTSKRSLRSFFTDKDKEMWSACAVIIRALEKFGFAISANNAYAEVSEGGKHYIFTATCLPDTEYKGHCMLQFDCMYDSPDVRRFVGTSIKEDGVLNHDMELATGKEASETEPNTDGFEGIKAEDLYYTPDSLGLTRSEELTKSDYSDFFRDPKVTEQFNEYFDISDRFTRKALLALNEADQNTVLVALTSKLYDSIVNKVDEIDFGDIPNTKGDITKLPNYEKIRECISIIRDILVEYKEDTAPVDEVSNALSHISTRKEMFERAFRTDAELPIITYNSIVLAIVNSVSYMIATSIEFIKTPNQDTFKIVLDKVGYARSKHSLLYNNLKRFNKCCESGEFDKAMEHVIQQRIDNKAMREGAISTTVAGVLGASAVTIAIVAIIANIIPILRELVFFFYYTRMRVSDFFDIQADLLQMNAHNLDTSSDRADKDRVVSKQLKVVEMFRKIANKISFTGRKAEVNAEKEITASSKKMKLGDVVDEMPDSVSSALF